MLALCVDDEQLLLEALKHAVEASPDVTETAAFRLGSEALNWASDHSPDVAFLDIQLRGMTGLELAGKLREKHPDLPIVFCTGYKDYAFDAIQMRASGYLLKPIRPDAVQKEIDNIKKRSGTDKLLTVHCFGHFDVMKNGQPLEFKRKRSKELFAYLVDRRGASVTTKEIVSVLWEEDGDVQKNMMYVYKLYAELRDTLEKAGVGEVLVKGAQSYSIVTDKLDCDFYHYLKGEPEYRSRFTGEYMVQYPWAEETTALLQLGEYEE